MNAPVKFVHTPECTELADALYPLASTIEVRPCHWIATPDGEYLSNNGNEWCPDCGTYMVRHLRRRDRKHREDYLLDGGWRTEHEKPPFCAHCGVKLEATLLKYAVESELDHFHEHPPQPGNANEAYEIRELLFACEVTTADDAELVSELLDIARTLVAASADGRAPE